MPIKPAMLGSTLALLVLLVGPAQADNRIERVTIASEGAAGRYKCPTR